MNINQRLLKKTPYLPIVHHLLRAALTTALVRQNNFISKGGLGLMGAMIEKVGKKDSGVLIVILVDCWEFPPRWKGV